MTSVNETNCSAFAGMFNPPLKSARTENINGRKVNDGWQAVLWDKDKQIGVTAVFYEGQVHAFLEAVGRSQDVERISTAIATALGRANVKGDDSGQET